MAKTEKINYFLHFDDSIQKRLSCIRADTLLDLKAQGTNNAPHAQVRRNKHIYHFRFSVCCFKTPWWIFFFFLSKGHGRLLSIFTFFPDLVELVTWNLFICDHESISRTEFDNFSRLLCSLKWIVKWIFQEIFPISWIFLPQAFLFSSPHLTHPATMQINLI